MARVVDSTPLPEVECESVPCNLCAGENFETIYADCRDRSYRRPGPEFSVVRCWACALAQTRPRPVPGSISNICPSAYGGSLRVSPRHGVLSFVREAFRLRYGSLPHATPPSRPGSRVVDVGGAGGHFLAQRRRLGRQRGHAAVGPVYWATGPFSYLLTAVGQGGAMDVVAEAV